MTWQVQIIFLKYNELSLNSVKTFREISIVYSPLCHNSIDTVFVCKGIVTSSRLKKRNDFNSPSLEDVGVRQGRFSATFNIINQLFISLVTCRGITRIHRSPSRPRPSMRPTAALINIHEHLI